MTLVIRRARPADKRQVFAAVRTIWGGHDRVPGLFDRWVTHRSGPFFVGEASGRVVGMGKLTRISRTEGWLEGGRVAPRWRRRGIATALIAHRIAYAQKRGLAVLRFSTASDNVPIHRAARRFGFRRIASFARLEAPASDGAEPRRAAAGDLRAVARVVGPYVQFAQGWEWRTLTQQDIRGAITRRRVYVSGRPIVGAAAIAVPDDGYLRVVAIGGIGRAAAELLTGMRAEAARHGLREVSLYVSTPALERAARAAGYRRPWTESAYLYELRLSPRRSAR